MYPMWPVPKQWQYIATLRTFTDVKAAGAPIVKFYATAPKYVPIIKQAVADFASTLPKEARLTAEKSQYILISPLHMQKH